ncbi:hypothetical protein [Anaerostipes sp. Marseille-Q3525]|uniref:hypothetical protein n=1 Tax=Anaerostipes sp. Marseille-Q3525 TaxID=2758418 RepID=UPI001BAA7ACB|nr:hypothetical protein [Anaerostipes sp. Marseille-Q3525]MBR9961127.1 hypothetical protein [Anaerostipes sp. Marseille-Q3525]
MKHEVNMQAWQFYSNRQEEIIPCEYNPTIVELHVMIEIRGQMPDWLSEESPHFYYEAKQKTYYSSHKDQNLSGFYNAFVSIGQQSHMLLEEGDYIIRCKNGRFMTMKKDDFESLFDTEGR